MFSDHGYCLVLKYKFFKLNIYRDIPVCITRLLKVSSSPSCETSSIPILCQGLQDNFKEGKFPSEWKQAKIIPIFKSGSNNYRPISILPVLSKIMEHVVSQHLSKFLEDNKLLCLVQSGFQCPHSTISFTVQTDGALGNICKNLVTGVVFISYRPPD